MALIFTRLDRKHLIFFCGWYIQKLSAFEVEEASEFHIYDLVVKS